MSGITGISATFNTPNYHGDLFALTPADTPFLSAIGSLSQGAQATSVEFEWSGYDLRDPDQRTRVEGATAPGAEGRVRTSFNNIVQIHQEKVSVSYTKQAAVGQYSGLNISGGENAVTDEKSWQVEQALKQISRDANWSFLNGIYYKPADNTTARRTRGLLQAVTSNLVDLGTNVHSNASSATDTITPASAHSLAVNDRVVFTQVGPASAAQAMAGIVIGRVYYVQSISTTVSFKVAATQGGAAITVGTVASGIAFHSLTTTALDLPTFNSFGQLVFDNGGLTDGLGTLIVNSTQKVAISTMIASAYGKANPIVSGEKIGNVAIDQVVTDFGTLNIMLDRAMPRDAILLASLADIKPVLLSIPGKGVLFEEALAKTGASDDSQIYGEIGLAYGSQLQHGLIRGLPTK